MDESKPQLRRIGAGFCGTVWAAADRGSAFKRADGGPHRSLSHDFQTPQHIITYLQNTKHRIQSPACYDFIPPTSEWWDDNLERFPRGYEPCNTIHMQRIPPVSEATRRLLTGAILSIAAGRKHPRKQHEPRLLDQTVPGSAASPICLCSVEIQGLLSEKLSPAPRSNGGNWNRGIGYSCLRSNNGGDPRHWVAQIDGNDVEFVLASPNDGRDEKTESECIWSNVLGTHEMWMLDFDLARSMSMDEQGVRQAANAFRGNDPYFPKPEEQSSLWNAFREEYLAMSERYILAIGHAIEQLRALPGSFIRLVEEMACPGGSPHAQDSH